MTEKSSEYLLWNAKNKQIDLNFYTLRTDKVPSTRKGCVNVYIM